MPHVSIRSFFPADYDAVLQLWESCEGVRISAGDSRPEITRYLERNPGLSFVAEQDREIVGAILCGHDGRRGLIYHLAVTSSARGQGIGSQLVHESCEGLKREGIKRALILVLRDNDLGNQFWRNQGFELIDRAAPWGFDL